MLADLVLALGLIEREGDCFGTFRDAGLVELRRDDRIIGSIVVASGGGTVGEVAIESKLMSSRRYRSLAAAEQPVAYLVAGLREPLSQDMLPPIQIAGGGVLNQSSVATAGYNKHKFISVGQLRQNPQELVALLRHD